MELNSVVESQNKLYENIFDPENLDRWDFHTTSNPLIRYIRDHGMIYGLSRLKRFLNVSSDDIRLFKVLVICGGVGGEGLFLKRYGFQDVTVSDFSENALKVCRTILPDAPTILLNAENMDLEDESFDLVFVRAGLHHLSRPVLGVTEMIRVARKAIIFFEPHTGIISRLFGDEFENQDGVINYVFRWNQNILEQTTKSYLLKNYKIIKCIQYWNHPVMIHKIANHAPTGWRLSVAKLIYTILNKLLPKIGNSMIGIVVKK